MLHKLLSYGRKNRRGVILLLVSLLALWWGYTPLMAFVRWISDRQAVIEFIQGYGAWGVVLYILLMILQLFVAFIPGQALAIAAGYVFGFFPAVVITIPVAVAGSQLAFHLTRRYGRPLAYRFISPKTIERWEKISSRQGVMFYFFAFILPIFPSDAMCYVAGLATISARRFFIANVLGRCLSTIFTVMVGAYGLAPPLGLWITAGLVMLGAYIGWIHYSRTHGLRMPRDLPAPSRADDHFPQR